MTNTELQNDLETRYAASRIVSRVMRKVDSRRELPSQLYRAVQIAEDYTNREASLSDLDGAFSDAVDAVSYMRATSLSFSLLAYAAIMTCHPDAAAALRAAELVSDTIG